VCVVCVVCAACAVYVCCVCCVCSVCCVRCVCGLCDTSVVCLACVTSVLCVYVGVCVCACVNVATTSQEPASVKISFTQHTPSVAGARSSADCGNCFVSPDDHGAAVGEDDEDVSAIKCATSRCASN